jgi:hypothetical protein
MLKVILRTQNPYPPERDQGNLFTVIRWKTSFFILLTSLEKISVEERMKKVTIETIRPNRDLSGEDGAKRE